jgi:hypothetical protein
MQGRRVELIPQEGGLMQALQPGASRDVALRRVVRIGHSEGRTDALSSQVTVHEDRTLRLAAILGPRVARCERYRLVARDILV